MKRKNQLDNELRLIREGEVDPTVAKSTIDLILTEMAAGKPFLSYLFVYLRK